MSCSPPALRWRSSLLFSSPVLGAFPERHDAKVLVKLKRPPLPGTGPLLEILLHSTSLELRMPYSGAEYAYYHGRDDSPALSVEVVSPHAAVLPGASAPVCSRLLLWPRG